MKRVVVGMRVLGVAAVLTGAVCVGCQRGGSVTAGGGADVTAELAVDRSVELGETRLVEGHVVVRAENRGDSAVSVDFTQARLRLVDEGGRWAEEFNSPAQSQICAIGQITLRAKERRGFKVPISIASQRTGVRPEVLGISFGSGKE